MAQVLLLRNAALARPPNTTTVLPAARTGLEYLAVGANPFERLVHLLLAGETGASEMCPVSSVSLMS